jgi:hypothetical protein
VSADYVREYYKVPAKRGGRVLYEGRPGTIVGFSRQYLRIRLDGETRIGSYHPTWHIDYVQAESS